MVAPVRDEKAPGACLHPGARRRGEVRDRVPQPAAEAVPTARSGAHPELAAGGGQPGALVLEGMVGLVAPAQGDRVLGDAVDQFGMLEDDVAPEQRPAAAVGDHAVDPAQEVEVDGGTAALRARFGGAPPAEVEGLVQPDVETPAAELGQQFVVEAREQFQDARVGRAEAERFGVDGEGMPEALGHFGQRPVAVVDQPAVKVAEAVLVRRQLDEPLAAVLVELPDLLGGERGRVAPDLLVVRVGVGVFDVELEVVDLPLGEPVDQPLQVLHLRHAVPTDVQHRAADGEVRAVFDLDGRDREAGLRFDSARLDPLFQGRGGPEQAGRRGGADGDAPVVDSQRVALVGRNRGHRAVVGAGRVEVDSHDRPSGRRRPGRRRLPDRRERRRLARIGR